MRRTAITLLIACGLAAPVLPASAEDAPTARGGAAAADASTPILPGYWEYSTRVFGIGSSKKKCLKADEVEDFLTRPCNRHYTCVYPTKQVGGGKLLLDGYWQSKEGKRAKVHASGEYQPRSFAIKANGTAIGGIPFMASMNAKWLGAECPGGEQAAK